MAQLEEDSAMEEKLGSNCKPGLSWRSRNTSWWTSAVDLSSTFLSKMDQVPASLVSFTLPWHTGGRADQSKAPQRGENQPVELPLKPRNDHVEAEPLEIAEVSPGLDCEPAAEEDLNNSSSPKECGDAPRGAESRRRTKRMPVDLAPADPKHGDDDAHAPIRSKKLSAVSQEFLLGQQGTNNPASLEPNAEEMRRLRRPRKHSLSNVDAAILINLTNTPHALPPPPSEELQLESNLNQIQPRIRLQCDDAVVVLGGSTRVTTRSDYSEAPAHRAPSASLPSSPRSKSDSRASRLLRTLGISTTHPKLSRQQVVNNLIVSQHQRFAKSFEPRKPGITNGSTVRHHQEGVEHSQKKSSWLFKWIWASPKPKPSPQAANMDTSSMRHSSWGCASHASTTVIPHTRRSRIHQDDMVDDSFRDCSGSFRVIEDASSSNHGSFRESFEDCHGSFEDCHGSFRSVTSEASPLDNSDLNNPPPLLQQQQAALTIGDVAALCNSSLKFVFKCREIQHFNKFLRSQKKRLLSTSAGTDSSDCFHVVLSGIEIEVSSMVAAVCYAWFLHNTAPSQTSWPAVPMIDIPRHQMHQHKDAAWLFDACGIDPATLLFADEMDLASMVGAGRIKFSTIGQDVLVTRNEVGSVCTLLGEKLVAEAKCLLEPRYMKTLLLAGVLLDTENLDFASMRDTEITTTLLVGSGSLGRNGFFDQLRDVEDDEQVSKLITRSYGDAKQLARRKMMMSSTVVIAGADAKIQQEAEQEQSDKDSVFTHSQDQTSTGSEAGTSSSSLDEDSPRLKQQHSGSFKYTKLPGRSAPARPSRESAQSPESRTGCQEDEKAVAHIRKAATQFVSSSCGTRSSRIRKKLILYRV